MSMQSITPEFLAHFNNAPRMRPFIDREKRLYGYGPGAINTALYRAGAFLREHYNQPVSNRLVKLTDEQSQSVAYNALATIINTSIKRPAGRSEFRCSDNYGLDSCIEAEGAFLYSLRDFHPDVATPTRAALLVHDKDDEPVLYRKAVKAPTSLALRPITIDGIEYPAGSIVQAVPNDTVLRKVRTRQKPLEFCSTKELTSVGFLRLSQFCLGRAEQEEYGWKSEEVPFEFKASISNITVDTVKELIADSAR